MMHAQITACFWWTCSLGNNSASDENGGGITSHGGGDGNTDGYSCVDGSGDGYGNGNGKNVDGNRNDCGNGKKKKMTTIYGNDDGERERQYGNSAVDGCS